MSAVESPGAGQALRRGRTWPKRLGSALLNLAALGGVVCIVMVILSAVFNISLIMFKTGSMSPTIPAGSLAVVREIPAQEIAVGDVVTVEREGMLPVTHRVTSVEGTGATRTITMRGDANDAEDPAPYTVTDVRVVLGSVPGLAYVVVWFSNPWVLGALTVSAAILVTWAFWPRSAKRPQRRSPRHGGASGGSPARDGAEGAKVSAGVAAGTAVLGVCLVLTVGNVPRAEAVPLDGGVARHDTVIAGDQLVLTSVGDAREMMAMRANSPVHWQVGIAAPPSSSGSIAIDVAAVGSRELGLLVDVRTCSERWQGDVCPGTERVLQERDVANVGAGYQRVETFRDTAERWVLITGMIPEPASGTVALMLRVTGSGESVVVEPGPVGVLPETGSSVWGAGLLGMGALVLGLSAAALAAVRMRVREARRS